MQTASYEVEKRSYRGSGGDNDLEKTLKRQFEKKRLRAKKQSPTYNRLFKVTLIPKEDGAESDKRDRKEDDGGGLTGGGGVKRNDEEEDNDDDSCLTIATIVEKHSEPKGLIYCHRSPRHSHQHLRQHSHFNHHHQPHLPQALVNRVHVFSSLSANFSIFFNLKSSLKSSLKKHIPNAIRNDYPSKLLLLFEGL